MQEHDRIVRDAQRPGPQWNGLVESRWDDPFVSVILAVVGIALLAMAGWGLWLILQTTSSLISPLTG